MIWFAYLVGGSIAIIWAVLSAQTLKKIISSISVLIVISLFTLVTMNMLIYNSFDWIHNGEAWYLLVVGAASFVVRPLLAYIISKLYFSKSAEFVIEDGIIAIPVLLLVYSCSNLLVAHFDFLNFIFRLGIGWEYVLFSPLALGCIIGWQMGKCHMKFVRVVRRSVIWSMILYVPVAVYDVIFVFPHLSRNVFWALLGGLVLSWNLITIMIWRIRHSFVHTINNND